MRRLPRISSATSILRKAQRRRSGLKAISRAGSSGNRSRTRCAHWQRGVTPIGIVCGTGFEDRPDLLRAHRRQAGRSSGIRRRPCARAKDPEHVAATLCPARHPASGDPPGGRLRRGLAPQAARRVRRRACLAPDRRGSRIRTGSAAWRATPVSALVLGNGSEALVLGLSAQWADPARARRSATAARYGPPTVGASVAAALEDAAQRIVEALGLVGLNSVDFLVGRRCLASDRGQSASGCDARHLRFACSAAFRASSGRLPRRASGRSRRRCRDAAAARIVYARRDIERMPEIDWPDWTADRQPPGTHVASGRAALHGAGSCRQRRGGAKAGRGARRQNARRDRGGR